MEASGCLTEDSCRSLFPVIRKAMGLAGGGTVTVDLSRARHIEQSALDFLTLFAMQQADPSLSGQEALLAVTAPEVLPACRAAGEGSNGSSRPALVAA